MTQRKSLRTTDVGFVNRNRQEVVRPTGRRGDANQKLYELTCQECRAIYLANGADIHERLCPDCQGGRPSSGSQASDVGLVDSVWTVADAKARFSEVIGEASRKGPQVITRSGKRVAVIVSAEEWERRTRRKGTLAEFFLNSPLRGAELDLERLQDKPRDIDF